MLSVKKPTKINIIRSTAKIIFLINIDISINVAANPITTNITMARFIIILFKVRLFKLF